ncbi:hypothetical protein [Pontibacillus salipaludis]|uniref:Cytochrome c oxidase subunit 4 n=1 Tax=Pontibacillus salipaludis TaxID=1697394 RepID=A0ABQ1Q040_9BACI|nr:hypothetical protein [Pontibacillus salipaludis]GGD08460.1 hypothetical protein GCM10011389_15070 [Pontibacillus salipaludis]
MYGYLNLASLFLGILAWSLPVVNLMRDQSKATNKWMALSVMSFSACGISLVCQILYTYHKVSIGDWAALMDTMYAVAIVSSLLLIVTILLNALTLIVYRKARTF